MEISQPSRGIYFVSKFLALAPYSIRKNSKNVYVIRRSLPFLCYAFGVTITMVYLTYRGLHIDASSKIPIRSSLRDGSSTSKVVTTLDVSVIAMSTIAGVTCGILALNATKELNERLQKVDTSLNGFISMKRERIKAIFMISLPMLALTILMCFDFWTWTAFAENVKHQESNAEKNVLRYIPFYGLYFMLMGLHVSFANTAMSLSKRFKSLNLMLKTSFLPTETGNTEPPKKEKKVKITTVIPANLSETASQTSLKKLNVDASQKIDKSKVLLLEMLAESHESLGKCVDLLSRSYGFAVLCILVSCFLHLLATAYFLFVELLSKKNSGYVWLQVLWIAFHSSRLLLVVEPCHRITTQSTKTIQILCEIERVVRDSILAEEIRRFWEQLLVFNSHFSACGLCVVDRSLLTSLFSAIATYLVILIQFNNPK